MSPNISVTEATLGLLHLMTNDFSDNVPSTIKNTEKRRKNKTSTIISANQTNSSIPLHDSSLVDKNMIVPIPTLDKRLEATFNDEPIFPTDANAEDTISNTGKHIIILI